MPYFQFCFEIGHYSHHLALHCGKNDDEYQQLLSRFNVLSMPGPDTTELHVAIIAGEKRLSCILCLKNLFSMGNQDLRCVFKQEVIT